MVVIADAETGIVLGDLSESTGFDLYGPVVGQPRVGLYIDKGSAALAIDEEPSQKIGVVYII